MKKLLVLVIAIISTVCFFAISSNAVVPTELGDCVIGEGEDAIVKKATAGLDYSILSSADKTATLSGNRGITSGEIVIASTVVIDNVEYTVVQTNAYVFQGSSITAIYVPNTVEKILGSTTDKLDNSGTFANCKSLSEVYIGTGIKEFGRFAFTSIGATSGVSKFIVKGKVELIRGYAFNCANFNSDCEIECDTSALKKIESNAFANGGKAIRVINSPVLEELGERAFGGSPTIEYVLVPENCTLGQYVFNGLSGLKTVIIRCAEDEIKELPRETFSNDSKFDLYIDGQVIATGNHVLGFGDMRVYFENYEDIGVLVESVNSGYEGSDRLSHVTFFTCNPSYDGYYKFKANQSSVITAVNDGPTEAPHGFATMKGLIIPATCVTPSKTYDVCEICNRECNIVNGAEPDKNAHAFETVEMVAATCIKDGYEVLNCKLCSYTERNILTRTGHDFIEKIKPSSCTSIGFTTFECKSCGHKEIGIKTPQSQDHTYAEIERYVDDSLGAIVVKSACKYCGYGETTEKISLVDKTYIKDYKTEIFGATTGLSYTYDDEKMTATVTGGELSSTALYIPSFVKNGDKVYKVTAIGAKAFQSKGLTAIYVPDTVTVMKGGSGQGCFGNNSALTTIVVGSGVTQVEQEVFSTGVVAYIEEFVFKATITHIGGKAFNGVSAASTMTSYKFDTRLVYIGDFIQGTGTTINLIREVYITYECDLSATCCLNGAAGLKTVYIEGGETADTAKVLTRELFSGPATNLNIYIDGYVTVPTIEGDTYTGRAVLPTSGANIHMESQDAMRVFIAAMAHNAYNDRATNSTWYDCETLTSFTIKTISKTASEIVFNDPIGYAGHNKTETVVPATCQTEGSKKTFCFVCGFKFHDDEVIERLDHNFDGGVISSMPNCKNEGVITYYCYECKETVVESIAIDPEYHNYKVVILYNDGFDKKGTQYEQCENCNDEINVVEIKPIFTPKGYSMNGTGDAIIAGYEINIEMLENYKKHYNVKFGVIIGNADFFTGNAFIENGVMKNEFGIQLEITQFDFSMVKCTINGYNEAYDDLELVVALYVIDADGNVSYVQKTDSGYYASTVTKDVALGAFTRTTIKNVFDSLVESTQVKAIIPGDDE